MSGHVSPKSVYYGIFGELMISTAVSVGSVVVNLGSVNFPVSIWNAITKATMVILFFMHVKYSSRLTKMVVGMAFFFLAIMFALTLTDYLSCGWYASPRGSTGAGTQVGVSANPPARTETAPAAGEEPAPRRR